MVDALNMGEFKIPEMDFSNMDIGNMNFASTPETEKNKLDLERDIALQKLTDKFVEEIARHGAHKEKEIMEV